MSKSINIFYPPENPNTGGWVVEDKMYKVMRADGRLKMHSVLKSNFFAPRYKYWNLFAIAQIRKLAKYDILLINSDLLCNYMRWFVRTLKFFCPKKIIVTSHHHFEYHLDPSFEKTEKSMLGLCDYIISYSDYVHAELSALYPGEKLLFAPLPFNGRGEVLSSHEKGKLLFAGTVEPRKGLECLIDALVLLDEEGVDFSLDIVGNDAAYPDYVQALRDRIESHDLGAKVKIHGRVGAEVLEAFYSKAYCFAFPSLLEGFGMVIMESMAHGVPVVAFDNSAMPYTIVDGRNGMLALNKDVRSLAAGLKAVLTDEDLHSKLVAGALETARNAPSDEDFAAGVTKIIDTLCSQSK